MIDIILEDDRLKEKLLMTNVKNSKNSEYYEKVIKELKERCQARDEVFEYDVKQTREKFKRCIGICKDAAMKIKTASGITCFQEEKEYGTWFNNLFNVMKSITSSQSNLWNQTPKTMVAAVIRTRGVETQIHQQENKKKRKKGNYLYLSMKLQKKRQGKEKND